MIRERRMAIGSVALRFSILVAALTLGCSRDRAPTGTKVVTRRTLAAPAPSDAGDDCADIGTQRACFTASEVLAVPRPVPSRASERGFRCWGVGPARMCEDRGWQSDAFSCNVDVCTQKTPRLPDDGEWECADLDGVVLCHGGRGAAGVIPGPPDVGWRCGARRGVEGDRVCVDFAPDRPGPEPWTCRFQYDPGLPRRTCTRGGPGALGRACGRGCPFGSACRDGHCLPLRPEPSCWLDRDCGEGQKCALGTCREASP